MIEKIVLKENLSIKEAILEPSSGLNVFSGASGAGKSIFFESLLGVFGLKDTQATSIEAEISASLELQEYGIEVDDEILVFKALKKDKQRFFINNQSISKKVLKELSSRIIKHINQKESSEFETQNLISLLDEMITKQNFSHKELVESYKDGYLGLKELKKELAKISEEERKIEELKEFALFEIKKIDEINPKIGEYDELLEHKKRLSKKEKLTSVISSAHKIFDHQRSAKEALLLLEIDSTFLDSALEELKGKLDGALYELEKLDELDIEKLLDRLEALSSLNKKYGSIEEALEHREKRKKEYAHYENLSFEKDELEKRCGKLNAQLTVLAEKISSAREAKIAEFDEKLNHYLGLLLLKQGELKLKRSELNPQGADECELFLNSTTVNSISSGEFNRLRLALMALRAEYFSQSGVLILDEIDANLSGQESHGVAHLLKSLSSSYQLFVISHQPHLPSLADSHYLVKKDGDSTIIERLDGERRIQEIARTVSGKEITKEALELAKKMLEAN